MKIHPIALKSLIGLFGILLSMTVNADEISIERASGRVKDNNYLIEARIKYELGESVIEAMQHGITLDYDVTVKVLEERKFLWDKSIKTEVINFQMEYQPLINRYLVINQKSGSREQLPSLDTALKFLGTINNYNFIPNEVFEADESYAGLIKAKLKISTLPLPLQPIAYISPSWHLESHWYEWTVR